jgi:low temperature requirement protein LtrA
VGREQEGELIMDWLFDKLSQFNHWYDAQQEPKRFLLFITLMILAIFPLQLGVTFGHPIAALFGLGMFTFMSMVAVLRAFGFGGKHKYAAYAVMGLLGAIMAIAGFRIFLG